MLSQKLIIFTGKGGVGKTSLAASYAFKLADQGQKVLLISTDPAHNISDVLKKKIGPKLVKFRKNIHILEIDSDLETKQYLKTVGSIMKSVTYSKQHERVEKYLSLIESSPGAQEAAIMEKLELTIRTGLVKYDKVIMDTAPTGHTLRMVNLPESIQLWIESLIQSRSQHRHIKTKWLNESATKEDMILSRLIERQKKYQDLNNLLTDKTKTAVCLVMNPEQVSYMETKRSHRILAKSRIPVFSIIINKIWPEIPDSYFESQYQNQHKVINRVQLEYKDKSVIEIPFLRENIIGLDVLSKLSKYLF
jgi:arsenite-transporting ATPase